MPHVVHRIQPYLAGALSPSEKSAFEHHLALCPECAGLVSDVTSGKIRPVLPAGTGYDNQLGYGHPHSQYWTGNNPQPTGWYVAAALVLALLFIVVCVVAGHKTNAPANVAAVSTVSSDSTTASDSSSDADPDDRTSASDDKASDNDADSDDVKPQPPAPRPQIIRTPTANRPRNYAPDEDSPRGSVVMSSGTSSDDDSTDTPSSSGSQNYIIFGPPTRGPAQRPPPMRPPPRQPREPRPKDDGTNR